MKLSIFIFTWLILIFVQPSSCQTILHFSILEESDDRHVGFLNVPNVQDYRLSSSRDLFQLDENTGELRTLNPIDRESLDSDVVNLLAISDSVSQAPIEIRVEIRDINDNNPMFPSDELVVLDLQESTEIGTQFVLPTATDNDLPQNDVSTKYDIVAGGDEKFSLFVDSSPGDESLLYLRTEERFNREDKSQYRLNISATDNGEPPRSGFLSVLIEILDNNDNEPLFDFSHYSASVPEDTLVGSVILNVHATDTDEGDNGLVRYRIGGQSESRDYFTIDPFSGNLSIIQRLDFETATSHRLTLEAYDGGDPVLFGRAFVTVTVENVNDNNPVIQFRFLPPTASIATVNEGAQTGTNVVLITVTDEDSSRSFPAELGLSLTEGNELDTFELVEIPNLSFWELKVRGSISRSLLPFYNLTFCAEDFQFFTTRVSCRSIIVTVNSPNEHPPLFSAQSYQSNVSEIAPIGFYVVHVKATDSDSGIAGRLRYRIDDGNARGWFRIDTFTGIVTTASIIDYDVLADKTITLSISAYDETLTPLTSNTTVFIDVIAVNDNVPRFESDLYRISVRIDSLPATVSQVTAHDIDVDQGENFIYSISNIYPTLGPDCSEEVPHFSINNEGLITLLSLPEPSSIVTKYSVVVVARNTDESHLSSSTVLEVTLVQTEINKPVFYPLVYFASLQSSSLPNPTLVYVKATTATTDENSSIQYLKTSGDNKFNVDAESGRVFVSNDNIPSIGTFTLQVNAFSNGLSSSEPAVVHVVVNPTLVYDFTQDVYEFQLLENSEPLTIVGMVNVPLPDNSNSTFKYYIVDGNKKNLFYIDHDTGKVSLNVDSHLDFEDQSTFNLTIVAAAQVDSETITQFKACTFLVHVVDINDNNPYFSKGRKLNMADWRVFYEDQVVIYITSNRDYVSRPLYYAPANDCDANLNSEIIYSIHDPLQCLEVDEEGTVYVKRPFPDFHHNYIDDVIVTACDQGSPCRCVNTRLRVDIRQPIEAALRQSLINNHFKVSVYENTTAGTKVLQLSDYLPPKYSNPTFVNESGSLETLVDFAITSAGHDQLFGVFPNGEVYLMQSNLDRESASEYDLTFSIRIHEGGQTYNHNGSLKLYVLDVDDNNPEFQQSEVTFYLDSNTLSHTLVGRITATDIDSGVLGQPVYTIREAYTTTGLTVVFPFAVDRYTGVITTNCNLNLPAMKRDFPELFLSPDTLGFYVVTHNKNKASSPSINNVLLVKIIIRKVTNYPLKFLKGIFNVNVIENSPNNTDIVQIEVEENNQNRNITFKIQPSNQALPFTINRTTGLVTVSKSSLLDREKVSLYTFNVLAVDHVGFGRFTSSATVNVRVLDINDNPPQFDNSTTSWSVSERTRVYEKIGQIIATDPDKDEPNNLVSYKLSSENTDSVLSLFHVDESSGNIILIGELDREIDDSYNLIVEASDSGSTGNTASTTVRIFVEDANDQTPRISSSTSFRVLEDFYPDPYLVGVLTAVDDDVGENGQIFFEIIRQNPYSQHLQISITPLTGHIFLTGTIDRENYPQSKLELTVRISDNPSSEQNRLWSTSVIEIIVDDQNDHSPAFVSPDTIFIPHNRIDSVGYEIATIVAEDPDNGPNGTVRFVDTVYNQNEPFTIEPDTGVIQLSNPLSRDHSVVFSLKIMAQDQGIPERYALEMINVIVGDISLQNGPVFNSLSYTRSILENSEIGTEVVSLTASGNEVNYFIVAVFDENDVLVPSRPFAIDSQSGVMRVEQELDRETVSAYIVQVVAVDMTSSVANPRMTSTQVLIAVLDVNDNRPEFSSTEQIIRVAESAIPGSPVATVTATDVDSSPALVYSLQSGISSNKFIVNPNSGVVSIGSLPLDREEQERHILTILASDGLHQTSTTVLIYVDDVNDNNPEFSAPFFVFSVQEGFSTPPSSGRYVGLVKANDLDSNFNAEITYSFVNESDQGIFSLNAQSGLIHLNPMHIEELDREERDLYVFVVRATDGGGIFTDVIVYVNIIDVNDNFPIFTNSSFEIEIDENVDVGYHVTTVPAEDADLGFNSIIQYFIIDGDSLCHFSIGLSNGVVTTIKRLDKETRENYHLVIMATDLGNPSKSSFINVTVVSRNINDNSPNLILPELIYIDEDISIDDVILQVGAFDMDDVTSNITSLFQYSLISQEPNQGIFAINADSGDVRVQMTSFEFEEYNISIAVNDRGSPELSRSASFLVRISHTNKHKPLINHRSINQTVSIREDALPGKEIAVVTATDEDGGYNGFVKYRFQDDSFSQIFCIDSLSGSVYLVGKLDFETIPVYILMIEAYDSGLPVRSSFTYLTINVIDVNDCNPVLNPVTSVVHVQENTEPSVDLIQLQVSDKDSRNGGRVDYQGAMVVNVMRNDIALSVNQFVSYFAVSQQGQVYLTQTLDREEADSYYVVVTAVDRGNPALTGTASILVVVDDVNEFSPKFESSFYEMSIFENATIGDVVTVVSAVDDDGTCCDCLRFVLETTDTPFLVHPATGEISVAAHLDRESRDRYDLQVSVFDGEGLDAKSATTTVVIQVLDNNDNVPQFQQGSYSFVSSLERNRVCGVVQASDEDIEENGEVVYSLIPSDGSLPFQIDSQSGSIRTSNVLSLSAYNFQITASNVDQAQQHSTIVNVTVTAVQGDFPSFNNLPWDALTIHENSTPNDEALFTVTATNSLSQLRYSIVGGNLNESFVLDHVSGEIRQVKPLDYEATALLVLWIEAKTYPFGDARTSYSSLLINVEDELDEPPRFTRSFYVVHVREDVVNSEITTLTAYNQNSAVPGPEFQFSLSTSESEFPERFTLESETGILRNNVLLNREEKKSYFLTAVVTSSADPFLFSKAVVHVNVDDVNDNGPSFSRLYSATVREDAEIGEFVVLVTSTDEDTEEFSQNRYSLSQDDDNKFRIDPFTGVIRVNGKLDRENQSSYTLQVTAEDGAWSSHTRVFIDVTDVNDNAPIFESNHFHVDVDTGLEVGTKLLELGVTDIDTGKNQLIFFDIQSYTEYFTINHTSGELFSGQTLHCSTETDFSISSCPLTYELIIKAYDLGKPVSLSSSVSVTVTVHSPNIYDPIFDVNPHFPVAMLQTAAIGTELFKVEASDPDGEEVKFSILDGSYSDYFHINQISGVLTSSRLLTNLTPGSIITFTIQVADDGHPTRYADLLVSVEVTGENINRPSFDRDVYSITSVAEDTAPETIVATVSASDTDTGVNGMISYSLSEQDASKPFRINSTTGNIFTVAELNYEEIDFYVLTAIASDRAVLPQNSSVEVTIFISDVNDNPPQFNSTQFVVYVPENTPPETIITRIVATDADSSENAGIDYEVYPQNEFMVRSSTGDISTGITTNLNYETQAYYQLQLMAFNYEDESAVFHDSTLVHVIILDENEFTPVLMGQSSILKVSVTSTAGTIVKHLQATDQDGGVVGQIVYILAGWSENRGFEITYNTGELFLSENADLILGDVINITVFLKNPGLSYPSTITRFDLTIFVITDDCMNNPCQNGASCLDEQNTFVCVCLPGFQGELCEENINDCLVNPCLNGGVCTDLTNNFQCTCPTGLTGILCDTDIDFCESNPCENNGTCQDGLISYTCHCPFGATGYNCQYSSLGFSSLSYLRLASPQEERINISFHFATVLPSALLLYYFDADNQTDFFALEIIEGRIRFSYRFSSANNNRTFRIFVGSGFSDGDWHQLLFVMDNTKALITIDSCEDGDASCSKSVGFFSVEHQLFFTLISGKLFVGGIQSVDDILNRPDQVSSFDFVGCIRKFSINTELVESLDSPAVLSYVGISNGCNRNTSFNSCDSDQSSSLCGAGSTCTDDWFSISCDCPPNRSGSNCQDTRTGTSFNGEAALQYKFSPTFIRQSTLISSGVLSSSSARKKRSTDITSSSLTVRFRSRQSGQIFIVQGTNDEVLCALEIEENSLIYSYQTSTSMRFLILSEDIADGAWHEVHIRIDKNLNTNQLETTLDGLLLNVTSYNGGLSNFVDPNIVDSFYLGGSTTASPNRNLFTGCIFSFSVDNQSLPLAGGEESRIFTIEEISSTNSPQQNSDSGITNGCSGPDVCASNPCQSLGFYCNDTWNAFECVPLGQCISTPCLNGATCVPHSSGSYQCVCSDLYTGTSCQTFIPCIDLDCSASGVNQECVASESMAICQCRDGYELVDGRCALAAALLSRVWWIYVAAAIGGVLVIIFAALIGRYVILKRRTKQDMIECEKNPPSMKKDQKTKSPTKENDNFDKIPDHSIQQPAQQPRPDLLSQDVQAVDEEAVSNNISPSSKTFSRSSPNSQNNENSSPKSILNQLETLSVAKTISKSPLPSYEILMRERDAQINQQRLDSNQSKTNLSLEVKNKSLDDTPSHVIHKAVNSSLSDESNIYQHRFNLSNSSSNKSSDYDRSVYNNNKPKIHHKKIPSNSNSSVLSSSGEVQHIPKGKVSPTKSAAAFFIRQTQSKPFIPRNELSYLKPTHPHSRKSPGSVESSIGSSFSSSSSSSSHPRFDIMQEEDYPSVEEVMKQLNEVVGLTREEIELLNENSSSPYQSHSVYTSNPTPNSHLNEGRRTAAQHYQKHDKKRARPSSFSGPKIRRDPISKRSQTPNSLLPPSSQYKPVFDSQSKKLPQSENVFSASNSSNDNDAMQ